MLREDSTRRVHLRADYCLYSSQGELVAVIEAKRRVGTSPQWAAQLRRNLFAHGVVPGAPYFLIVTADRIYLWQQPVDVAEDPERLERQPDVVLDGRPIFSSYFEAIGVDSENVDGLAFEMIVGSWLRTLIQGANDNIAPYDQSLRELGERIQGGSLVSAEAA